MQVQTEWNFIFALFSLLLTRHPLIRPPFFLISSNSNAVVHQIKAECEANKQLYSFDDGSSKIRRAESHKHTSGEWLRETFNKNL